MGRERTLAIIKPDAVKQRAMGPILQRYEEEGFRIVEMKLARLTKAEAETFYAVHRARPFFQSLISFMISGPVVVVLLEGERAVERHRTLMGATDPAKAAEGTLRKRYGKSIEENAVHGSDSEATAKDEIAFFFGAAAVSP
ncbi:MAG: nucleoside-diphosphate kinase [Nitrospirae bacterium]|nr:nucleoside-diphosphate kinase [Nitrospirota bacterium]